MRTNTRYTEAIQILCYIAIKQSNLPTSDKIAKSINTNAVVVRRIFKMLKDAELINIKRGYGGCSLKKETNEITLLDVYKAVETAENRQIFKFHEGLSASCVIGSKIEEILKEPFQEAQIALEEKLNNVTLENVIFNIEKQIIS
ncbi:MAG: Rrf2 family transcriptional regulator [Spirochaetaceae bacterium]|nr:Rrf2 family transcriptional regulator [Spirochaetaceae bacterium]